MGKPIRRVVVAGGGAAGWITAGMLANRATNDPGYSVTLIESSDVPIIGVGEGTWPTMRQTLQRVGIPEATFLAECNASFKQGSKFIGWADGDPNNFYYHPFSVPEGWGRVDLAPHWLSTANGTGESFSRAVSFQEAVCEAGLAPKEKGDREYGGALNYAYHLDAGKFAQLLKSHCVEKLGVRHVVDTIDEVQLDQRGYITGLQTAGHDVLEGDLFIDCTGFRSLLLGEALGVPFQSKTDVLFADCALALQVPYPEPDTPIASQTNSTAHAAGWIWDIGLTNRRGVGCVYSSAFMEDDEAERVVRDYLGAQADGLEARKIRFGSGHRETFWKKNCVAVGLSAGFLEPLEASALMLVEISAEMLTHQFPVNEDILDLCAERFNSAFRYRWDRIIDFLKLHYVLSQRSEPFWQANREAASIPDSLQSLMEMWRYYPPSDYDFSHNVEVFSAASFQYVLYGMGFRPPEQPDIQPNRLSEHAFYRSAEMARRAVQNLPPHRRLLAQLTEARSQPAAN